MRLSHVEFVEQIELLDAKAGKALLQGTSPERRDLRRYLDGEPLKNLAKPELGY